MWITHNSVVSRCAMTKKVYSILKMLQYIFLSQVKYLQSSNRTKLFSLTEDTAPLAGCKGSFVVPAFSPSLNDITV